MTKMFYRYKLHILFLSAFLIRLINLNQSLWLDEATTAITVKMHSLTSIITQFSPTDFHPPLYYLFIDIWTNVFGYSEIALRMPSVLFSLGAGYAIYKIMQNSKFKVQNYDAGFWAAAFFLFNPLIIYYSQEARMYSMTTFLIAISFYYVVKIQSSKFKVQNRDFWLMNTFLILSFFTFYASIFYIATVYLYLLWKKEYKLIISSGSIVALGIAIISPLLIQQYAGSREALASVTNWSLVLGKVTLKNLLLIPIKFTSGRISFYPKLLYYALAGGWLGIVGISVIPDLIRNLGALFSGSQVKPGMTMKRMTLLFLITPLILGIIFSFNSPLLQYFRFQYLIIFLSIGLGLMTGSRIKSGMTYFLLFGFISWSLLYLLFPQFHREDWKSLANDVQKETRVVYMIPSSADPVRYYAPDIEIKDVRGLDSSHELRMTESFDRLFILPYTVDIHGVDYAAPLSDRGFTLSETKSFRELTLETWEVSGTP